MDENIKQKLFVWGQLYRQCEELELKLDHLLSVKASGTGCDECGSDAIEAELRAHRRRAEATFQEVSQALKRADSGARPADAGC
jgi:hypothetical protein